MNVKRIISTLILFVLAISMVSGTVVFSNAEKVEEATYVYAQLPGFEGLSNVQLAMVARENILRLRGSTSVHPEGADKSLEITVTAPAEGGEHESFSFATVTSIGKNINNFEDAAHDFPRGGEAFGGISLKDAERISFWVGDYPANGKVRIQLLMAPSAGLSASTDGYSEYPRGFVFESIDVSPVNGVVTFDFKDFTYATQWTKGDIYDYLSEINAVRVILTPGAGNAAYNTKFYIADMRIWKKSAEYEFDIGNGILRGESEVSAVSINDDVEFSLKINGSEISDREEGTDIYGRECVRFKFDSTAYPEGKNTLELYDRGELVLSETVMVDNKQPFLNVYGSDSDYGVSDGEITIPTIMGGDSEDKYYHGEFIPVNATENLSSLKEMKQRDPKGETPIEESVNGYYSTTSTGTGIPYQAYELDVTGRTGEIILNYKGNTIADEQLIMEVYVPSSEEWETVARGDHSGKDNEFTVPISVEKYADSNDKIKVRVSEYLYGNGSDVFAWTTDTQYYIGFSEHILHHMVSQFNWLVEEYQGGNIAYVTNTGDVVETLLKENQYVLAREVHDILDKANVPNGVTPGNHDVNNAYTSGNEWTEKAYAMWNKYFGDQYYKHQPWWGGGYLSNTSHYDLITIGGRDFVFLYLGLNHEVTPEGIAWANTVLKRYSHRTAVIATHQYVAREGGLLSEPYGYAPQIIEHIIEPNPNVRLVICGHEPGAQNQYNELKNGVKLVELLHDYQFTEDWGYWEESRGGKGYFRYMTVGDNTITSRTYSADFPDIDHFFPEGSRFKENYTMDIEYVESNRQINTAHFQALSDIKELGEPVVSENGELNIFTYDGVIDGSRAWFVKNNKNGKEAYGKAYPIVEKILFKKVVSLEITTLPEKLVYIEGEKVDPTGMVITATFNDGSVEQITEYEISELADALGTQTVTVSRDGVESTFEVTVKSKRIKGDFDADEQITVSDALAALRIAAKLAEMTDETLEIGDIDLDGEITVSDALAILRVAAKMADSL